MSSLSLNTMDKYLWNTGRVAAGHVVCTGVLPELEHSALAVGASRDDAHWQHKRRHTRVQKQRASSVLLRFPASRLIRRNIGREKRVEGMAAGAVCTRERETRVVPTIGTVSGVLDRHDDAGSEHELLPGLGKVDHVQSVRAALPDVRDLKSSQTTSARHNRAPR